MSYSVIREHFSAFDPQLLAKEPGCLGLKVNRDS